VIEVEPREMRRCSLFLINAGRGFSFQQRNQPRRRRRSLNSVAWDKVSLATFKESGLATGSRENVMPDHVYRIIEIAGSSEKSIEDAIQNAVGRASRTLRQVGWFEVVETRGHIQDGKVAHYQVALKVGFTLEDDD
jgi:flavin-binding protein dodecin